MEDSAVNNVVFGGGSLLTQATPKLIFKKMSDVMKEIKSVGKDQVNSAQGFKFRGIDQFVNALYPALCKHGVFMTTEVLERNEILKDVVRGNGKQAVDKHVSLKMKYTFHAEDGSSVSSSVAAEGIDSGDKATNKALSAALKYALIQTFSIPTEDMAEGDAETPVMGIEVGKDPSGKQEAPVQTKTASSSFKKTSFRKETSAAPAPAAADDGWS